MKQSMDWWIQTSILDKPKFFKEKDIPKKAIGFVYLMKFTKNGKEYKYIGKKNFYSNRKKKFGKKALAAITDKRIKKYEMIKKLSYINYFSSNEEIKKAYKEGICINRRILKICFTKSELTYEETRFQFLNNVLKQDEFLNKNILGRFYKGKV